MNNQTRDSLIPPLIIFASVVILWLAGAALVHFAPFLSNLGERGLFGDSFGAINALFAGLAFAGLIYAIMLQRQELQLQREELRLTRQELARSADAQEKSIGSLSEQNKLQTQTALLAAYTALLNWEMSRPAKGMYHSPTPEEIVDKIKRVLEKLENKWIFF